MKYHWFLLLLLGLSACELGAPLGKTYSDTTYKGDYIKLMKAEDLSPEDLLLIDYAIVRQRDYYNYEVAGKSYGEILEQAKTFSRDGLPIQEQIEPNGEQALLKVDIRPEGSTFTRKATNSSRLIKQLKFSCTYSNPTKKDLVLQNSSFLLQGPFKDHLSTVGYELNCLIKAGGSMTVGFITDAKNIRSNLLHDSQRPRLFLPVDSLLNNITIVSGGHSIIGQTEHYKECNHADTRVSPFIAFDYKEDLEALNNGRPKAGSPIRLGKAHYVIEAQEEPINLFQTN